MLVEGVSFEGYCNFSLPDQSQKPNIHLLLEFSHSSGQKVAIHLLLRVVIIHFLPKVQTTYISHTPKDADTQIKARVNS